MMRHFRTFKSDQSGATAVEFSLLTTIMSVATIGMVELAVGFFQYHEVRQAAHIGARIAVTHDPVAGDMTAMTGLGNNTNAGDAMPAYSRVCSGESQSCSGGTYDASAMSTILYGPDGDNACASTTKLRMGICDVQQDIRPRHVTVEYQGTGLGVAGNPATLSPVVTVRVTGMHFNLILLDALLPNKLKQMPTVEVSMLAEDLRTGS